MGVSITMPVYNCANTLSKSIGSILNQTYPHLNLILVDDGSKDNSLAICQEYASRDKRITVIHQENKGPSAARNMGILNSRDKYLMFIDADDAYDVRMVETMLKNIEESDQDLIICGINNISFSSRNKQASIKPTGLRENLSFNNRIAIIDNFEMILLSNLLNSPFNKLYKTDIIHSHNIFMDEKIDIGEDLQFNLEYLDVIESMKIIKDNLYNYYLDDSYLTKKYREDIFETRCVGIKKIERYFENNEIPTNLIDHLYIKLAFACFIQLFHTENKMKTSEKKSYIKEILKKQDVETAVSRAKANNVIQWTLHKIILLNSIELIYVSAHLMNRIKNRNWWVFKSLSV